MLDAALDRLFSASRAAFVAERQRLAKELKAAGKKDEAAQVAAIAKPTVAAWVVNQLARRHSDLIKRLGKAGARLREVQLGRHEQTGDDRRAFSEAVAAQREALREARVAAVAILSEEGNAAPVHLVETVLRILRGGAASDEAQATIAQGRLVREPAGGDEMGLLAGQAVFAVTGPGAATKASASAAAHAHGGDGKGGAAAKKGQASARSPSRAEEASASRAQKAAALAAERENARRRAAEEREVAKLRAAAEKADAQRTEREEDVEAARQTLAKAEARAAAAATAAETARAQLTEAERRLRAGVS
jgi:hypothetical protein